MSKIGKNIYQTKAWQNVRHAVLKRDGYKCRKCGRHGAIEIHHVVPLADGGKPFDMENLESLCRRCHFGETGRQNRARRDALHPLTPEQKAEREVWNRLVDAL